MIRPVTDDQIPPRGRAIDLARANRASAVADLVDELRIPSISTLLEHRHDVRRNAEWLAAKFSAIGMRATVVDVVPDGHPVVRAEWLGRPGAQVLTIYGHYDVQPPDPLAEWHSPPFEPTVRDGFLYARGVADNKGNHMAALKAAEYALSAGGPPINLRFLIEGEEEISGDSLPTYLHQKARELASDHILLIDSMCGPRDEPALVTGLRGNLYVELEAEGCPTDLHSGLYGGAVANPIVTLARIVGELKGRDGRITIPGFYDDVRPVDAKESSAWDRGTQYDEEVKRLTGARSLEGEADYATIDRQWARPTFDVAGFVGGFTGVGRKTVIPSRCLAKVSMRLVPDQDANRILESLRAYVAELATPGVEVTVRLLTIARPLLVPGEGAGVQAARTAFEQGFGEPASLVRSGGSIKVALDFVDALGRPPIITGIVQYDCGLHAPNEKLRLSNYHRGIETLIHFMYELAEQAQAPRLDN